MSENKRIWPCQGKCDFRDDLCMIQADGSDESVEKFLAKSTIYVGSVGPLLMRNVKEAIPYMFHLISFACFSKEDKNTIYLSAQPWHDTEEKESLAWRYRDVSKYVKKCRRNKEEPSWETFNEESYCYIDTVVKVIFDRIVANPKLSFEECVSDLHTHMHNRIREDLIEFAKKEGCDMSNPAIMDYIYKIREYHKMFPEVK